MPHNENVALSGVITHVFAHRFTVDAEGTVHLADLGPKGAEAFRLSEGLAVTLQGERRPSEIKVTEIAAPGLGSVRIEHKKPHHRPGRPHTDAPADVGRALGAVAAAGWTPRGEPRRKPKHFEVLARKADGDWTELHVDFDGSIYKTKSPDAAKWGAEIG